MNKVIQIKPNNFDVLLFWLFACASELLQRMNHWGMRSTCKDRFFAFSLFIFPCIGGLIFQNQFVFLFSALVLMTAVVLTGARDQLGSFFNSKAKYFLNELMRSLLKNIQIIFNLPPVLKISIADFRFSSITLPVVLPPPRLRPAR